MIFWRRDLACHFDQGFVISTEGRNPMPREHRYFVYLRTNRNNKVMYVGMTNDLLRRVHEHRTKAVKGFTEKYNVYKLVYFEETSDVHAAIAREKEIKKWRREKKNALVNTTNPVWHDLAVNISLPPVIPKVVRNLAGGKDPDATQQDFSLRSK